MPISKNDLLDMLKAYSTTYEIERKHLKDTIKFVSITKDPFSRSTLQGHITASAWILSPDKSDALLIHHRKLDKWLQPGGHIEKDDDSVRKASQREAVEETGLSDIDLYSDRIFDIDIHTIPQRKEVPEHLHYDIRYCFIAKHKRIVVNTQEVKNYSWLSIDQCKKLPTEQESIIRMADKSSRFIDN